jgi:hypothetical protein
MSDVKGLPRAVWQKIRRVRALAKGEDADTWYEQHRAHGEKPPNVGPNLGGGGG